LLFGEHTWGPDASHYAGYCYGQEWKRKLAAGRYAFLLEGFDQKGAYVTSPASGEMISHGKPNLPSAKQYPYCAATAAEASVEIRSNAVSVMAVLKAAPRGIIPDATQLRVTLCAGCPYLDLEWSITNKTPDPWPEGGWLCFPLRCARVA
jgi:hypothetical protein